MKKMHSLAIAFGTILLASSLSPAAAAEFEVKMLNKGAKGAMVFEPDLVRAAPGDTIKFVPVDAGHNAETIKGMFPAGAEAFKSAPSKEFSVTLTEQGAYGIRCTPHYGMGMVALIVVGEASNLAEVQAFKAPGKAKKRFAEIFEELANQ